MRRRRTSGMFIGGGGVKTRSSATSSPPRLASSFWNASSPAYRQRLVSVPGRTGPARGRRGALPSAAPPPRTTWCCYSARVTPTSYSTHERTGIQVPTAADSGRVPQSSGIRWEFRWILARIAAVFLSVCLLVTFLNLAKRLNRSRCRLGGLSRCVWLLILCFYCL